MCSHVAGPSSSGSGDLFELSDRLNTTYFFSPITGTYDRHLEYSRDYNYHTFGHVTSSCIRSISKERQFPSRKEPERSAGNTG